MTPSSRTRGEPRSRELKPSCVTSETETQSARLGSAPTIAALKANGTFVVSNPQTNAFMLERGAAGGYQDYQLRKSREVQSLKVESLRNPLKNVRTIESPLFVMKEGRAVLDRR